MNLFTTVSIMYAIGATLLALIFVFAYFRKPKYKGSKFDAPIVKPFENFYTSEFAEQYKINSELIEENRRLTVKYRSEYNDAYFDNNHVLASKIYDDIMSLYSDTDQLYKENDLLKENHNNRQSQEA